MMSVSALHPEELLDLEASGAISAEQLARLDAHSAQCTTCCFERELRSDLQAATTPPLRVDALVTQALSGLARPVARRSVVRRQSRLLAAAVMFAGLISFAAVGSVARPAVQRVLIAMGVLKPTPAPVRAMSPLRVAAPMPSEEPLPPPPPPPVIEASVPAAAPEPAPPQHTSPRHRPPPPPVVEAAVLPPVPVAVIEVDAASLFAKANEARKRGEPLVALRAYEELVARAPGTSEANVALALMGRISFDQGRIEAAVEQWARYLATGDAQLEEEVSLQRAIGLGQLGRAEAEREAWREFLRAFPESAHAAQARQRVDGL